MTTVTDAKAALDTAEEKLVLAEAARDRARDELDRVLVGQGWRRLGGVFTAGATPRYQNPLYPAAAPSRDEVIAILERQQAATR